MSKARTLADFISDGSEFADGTISVAEVSGAAPLASPSFTGATSIASGSLSVTGTTGIALGDATPATFGSGVPTVVFQGTAANGRGGAINFREYAASGDGAITSQIYSTDGADGYGFVLNAEQGSIKLNAGGLTATKLEVTTSGVVINETGADNDFRVESDNQANMLFVDAGNDRIGIGTNSPALAMLHVANAIDTASWHDNNTVIYTLDGAITEAQSREMFRITAGSTRTSCHVRITFSPRSSGGIGSMSGGYMDCSIWRADGGVFVKVERIQNNGAGSGSVSMMMPTVSGNTVTFGMNAGNNGTGSTYGVETRVELTSHYPANWTVADQSAANATHSGTSVKGGFYIGGNDAQNIISYRYNGGNDIVINEDSQDADFRIESDSNTHALFMDAGASRVGINRSSPSQALDVSGDARISNTSGTLLNLYLSGTLTSVPPSYGLLVSNAGATAGHYSPAIGFDIGGGGGTSSIFAERGSAAGGTLWFATDDSGSTMQPRVAINSSGSFKTFYDTVLNESGGDYDFRVESNNVTHMLYVDAAQDTVSIRGSGTSATLNIGSKNGSTDAIRVTGAGGNNFISGYGNQGNISFSISEVGAEDPGVLKLYRNGNASHVIDAADGNAVIFNEQGENVDFRVESDSNSNMLVVDAGLNTVQVGTTLTYGGPMNVEAGGIGMGESGSAGYYRRIYWNAPNNEMRFWNGTNEARISSGGAFVDASDESLKKDIDDIDYGIETVKSLQPRKYKMKDTGAEQVGFIAQEMETQVPEVVSTGITPDGDEQKGISYGQLTAVLTKAMQEQQTMIETLEARIAALESPQP